MESRFISWIKRITQKISESKTQYITEPAEFRLLREIKDYRGKYDGEMHSFILNVDDDCEIKYSRDNKIWTSQMPMFKDVCKEQYYILAIRNKRYEVGRATVEIFPRNLILTSNTSEKVYDGYALKDEKVTILGDGLAPDDRIYCRASGSQTVLGSMINKINYTFEKEYIENNYKIELNEGKLSVLSRQDKFVIKISIPDFTCKYDGVNHKYYFTIDEEIKHNNLSYHVSGVKGEVASIDSGEYIPQLQGDIRVQDSEGNDVSNQFKVEINAGLLKIERRCVIISSGSAEKEYDGIPLECKEIVISGDGFIESDSMEISSIGAQKLVGKVENSISYKFNDEKLIRNYNIIVVPGTIVVTDRTQKFIVVARGKSSVITYDGKIHTIEGLENDSFIVNGQCFYLHGITASASRMHSGRIETEIKGIPVICDSDGNDVSNQFDIQLFPGTLCIEPRRVKITSASETRQYNGKKLENPNIVISEDGFCEEEKPVIVVSANQCIVGRCDNVFTYELPEGIHSEDYFITVEYGVLEVQNREKKYQIDIHMNSVDYLYDGLEHMVSDIEEKIIVVDGSEYFVEAVAKSLSAINAGKYEYNSDNANVILKVLDFKGRDVSEQFEINVIPGTLNIKKRKVILTSASANKEYDALPLSVNQITVGGDGFADNEGVNVQFTCSQLLPGESSNAFIYEFNENTCEKNYCIDVLEGTLKVADRSELFAVEIIGENREFLFNGEEKVLPEYADLNFCIDGNRFYIEGVSNIVSGIEEGVYTCNNLGIPHVFDKYNNDVSQQFCVTVIPGTLRILHNPEFDIKNDEEKIDDYDRAIHEILQKMSGEKNSESLIKKYMRKELEELYRDTKKLMKSTGVIDSHYEYLLKEQKEVDVLTKLHNRIVREFRNITLLSEIEINDREFDLLMYYFKRKYIYYRDNYKCAFVDIMFSVAMVQIGIRYYENNFWPQVEIAADIDGIDHVDRSWVGGTVTKTLLAFGKPVYSENKYVTNILMHCFITDSYAYRFFDYVFRFYEIDLERDISGLHDTDLEHLCDSIVNPYGKRKQLLSEYMAMSIRAAKKYCKDIIYNTLSMIDNSFWDEEYGENHLIGRLYAHFEKWKECSEFYQSEKIKSQKHQIDGKRVQQFRKPNLTCNLETGEFTVSLPSQIIPASEINQQPIVKWFIVSKKRWDFNCILSEGYSGYKTDEIKFLVEPEDIFNKYVFLLFSGNILLRSFTWDERKVQFFIENGQRIAGEHLEKGRVFAFSNNNSQIQSKALIYEGQELGLRYYELNLKENDFVCVPGEENYYIGQIPKQGLSEKEKINGLKISIDEKSPDVISVYSSFPELIIEVEEDEFQGTAIIVNGKVNKLSKTEFVDIRVGKISEKKYYFILTANLQGIQKGYNKIVIDYPKSQKCLTVEYYMLFKFSYEFLGAPYIFKDEGVLKVNRYFMDNILRLDLETEMQEISFNMSILEDGIFSIFCNDNKVLRFEVPLFLLSLDREVWDYKKPDDVWHDDFESMVYIKYPYNSLTLYVNGKNQYISRCIYKKRADGLFECDLTKLKSYFDKNKVIECICLENENNILFKIIQKSVLVDASLRVVSMENKIEAKFDILGKSNYYADLYCEDEIVAEKEPILNQKVVFDLEVETGDYTIKVFEATDEFSFDEDYDFIGEKIQTLINPADLIGSCTKINAIKSNDDQSLIFASEYRYYLFIEKQISKNVYEGVLTAIFHKLNVTYASKTLIEINDINNAGIIRIRRISGDSDIEFFVYSKEKEAIIDSSYKYVKEKQYTLLDPQRYYCCVDYISPNAKRKKESYEWIEKRNSIKKCKFSIWKD